MARADLFALAPLTIPNHRSQRYRGDELSVPLSAFSSSDQERIRHLYHFIQRLYAIIRDKDDGASETLRALAGFANPAAIQEFLHTARSIGADTALPKPGELLAKTIHDVRGGGLTFLIGRLQLAQRYAWKAEDARLVFFLARDHLKIMRSALLGLDDTRRAIDQQPRLHGSGLILEKWQHAVLLQENRKVRLEVDAHFEGFVSECCIEFGALDRVLYNLMNNACRHTADGMIYLSMLDLSRAKNDIQSENVRFVLTNKLTEADRVHLSKTNLTDLFRPGISTTHSGLGLAVVADFVAAAYGVLPRERALKGSYFGARLIDDQFVIWFHWPIASGQEASELPRHDEG